MENKFSHKNLSSRVEDHLKEEIFMEKYRGGDRILESEVAKELDISRAPVREAIRNLENQGLVRTIPRKGSFIVEFTEDDIREIFEIRLLLEDRVMKKLIRESKLNDKDFRIMENIIDEMVAIAERDYTDENKQIINMNKKDMDFHKYLWQKSDSKWTERILFNLHHQLRLAMISDYKLENNLVESAKIHYEIIKHLKKKDLKMTIETIKNHIKNYNQELMEKII